MPTVPVGFVRFNIVLSLANDPQDMMLTLAFDSQVIAEATTVQVCNDVFDAVATWLGGQASTYTLKKVDGYWGNGLVGTSTRAPDQFGGTNNVLPQNCAYLIHKNSGLGGRKNKGRMYLPGVAELSCDHAGNLDSGTITGLNAGLATLFTNLGNIEALGAPVILHGDAATPTPIVSFTADTRIATQRRRLR